MSIFASKTTSDLIPVPFDASHTITVRKLTGLEVEAAQEAHRSGIFGGSARTWAAVFRRSLEKGLSDPEVLQALNDPLTGFDRYAVMRAGLVAWSYPEPIKAATVTADGSTVVVPPDPLNDLVDEMVDFIATEIMRLTKPERFAVTADEAEAARKNG